MVVGQRCRTRYGGLSDSARVAVDHYLGQQQRPISSGIAETLADYLRNFAIKIGIIGSDRTARRLNLRVEVVAHPGTERLDVEKFQALLDLIREIAEIFLGLGISTPSRALGSRHSLGVQVRQTTDHRLEKSPDLITLQVLDF